MVSGTEMLDNRKGSNTDKDNTPMTDTSILEDTAVDMTEDRTLFCSGFDPRIRNRLTKARE